MTARAREKKEKDKLLTRPDWKKSVEAHKALKNKKPVTRKEASVPIPKGGQPTSEGAKDKAKTVQGKKDKDMSKRKGKTTGDISESVAKKAGDKGVSDKGAGSQVGQIRKGGHGFLRAMRLVKTELGRRSLGRDRSCLRQEKEELRVRQRYLVSGLL